MSIENDYRILEDYVLPPRAPLQTDQYYKYVKPTLEELDAKLEYDMDEEDFAWLELMNEQRTKSGLSSVSYDTFEALMDRFEKECFFHCMSKNFKPLPPELEHQADCAICLDGSSNEGNAILFCDMCSLSVHQRCYGVVRVPDEIWLCKRCLHSPAAAANCCLCPCKSGALKRALDGRWAHVTCTFWIPEVSFGDETTREPIMGIELVSSARWKLVCYICSQKNKGACLQCQYSNCNVAYHATCAQLVGLSMKMECHVDVDGVMKKKVTTYCDVHSPAIDGLDSNASQQMRSCNEHLISEGANSSDEESRSLEQSDVDPSVQKSDDAGRRHIPWKARLKQARKIVSLWIDMEQPIFVPVVNVACITKITRKARELNVDKSESFVGRLHSYWTLKRQSRDGYPLLNSRKFGENIKILNVNQFLAGPNEQQASSKEQENKHSHQPDDVEDDDSLENEITEVGSNGTKVTQQSLETVSSKEKKADEMGASNEDVACKNSSDNDDVMSDVCEDDDDEYESFVEHLRISHMLRRDLEKVRLLIELVRKREKLKAEQIRVREKQFECELSVINEGAHAMVQIIDEILKHFSSFQSKKVLALFEDLKIKLNRGQVAHLAEFVDELKSILLNCSEEETQLIKQKVLSLGLIPWIFVQQPFSSQQQIFAQQVSTIQQQNSLSTLHSLDSNQESNKKNDDCDSKDTLRTSNVKVTNQSKSVRKKSGSPNTKKMTSITSKNSVLSPTSSQRRRKSLTQLISSSDTTQLTSSSVATQLTSSLAATSSGLTLDVSTAVSHVLSSSGPLTVTTALSSNSLSVVMPTFIQMSGSPVLSHSTLSSPLQPTQLPGKQTRKPRKKMNESGDKINNSSSSNRNAAKSGNPKKLRGGSNEKEAFFEKMVYKKRMNKECSKKNQDSSVEQDHRHKDESDDNNSPGNGLTCGVMNESFQKYRTVTSDDDLENEGANLLRVATQKDQISKQQRKKHCSKSCELVETRSLSSSEVDNIEDMMEDDEASNEEDDDDEEEDDANYSYMDYKAYDVVWAKCHKHPWQPAMIIPSAPVTPPPNLCINMPTIPQETVDIISNNRLLKCVVFFDAKSSWKCLSVKKLLPLGVDACIDKSKLLSCKKMSSRRLMQSAYDKALMHLNSKRDYTDDGVNSQQQQQQYQQQLQQLQQQLQQQNLCGFEKVVKADDNLSNNRKISTHENNVDPVDVESQKSPS